MVSEVNHSVRDLTAVEATSQFRETDIGSIPVDWELVALGEAAAYRKVSMNPQRHPDEDFDYYSIPAYQVSSNPFVERGSQIRSQKLLVNQGVVLFGKLNPRVPKVWRVTSASGRRRIASTEFIPLSPVDGKICSDFLYYLAWSDYILPRSQELVSGSTPSRQRVDVKAFLRLPIPLPPLPEQRAIAGVLGTVERAIQATEAVIAAARELKRSLMRHLFTYGPVPLQEAERLPLKETEIGPVPEHWEVVRLGDIAETKSGGTPSRKRKEYYGGAIPWVKSGELGDSLISSTDETITRLGLCESSARVFPGGTLLVALYGATAGKVGMLEVDAATNQAVCAVFPSSTTLPGHLLYALIHRRADLLDQRYGGAQPNISQTLLRNFKVPVPSLSEQRAIVKVLKSIDRKIDVELNRMQACQSLFKSLLHHLMTGKIRVKPEAAFEETGQ